VFNFLYFLGYMFFFLFVPRFGCSVKVPKGKFDIGIISALYWAF